MSAIDARSGERPAHSVITAGRSPPTRRFASSAAAAGVPCQVVSTARAHSPQLFGRSFLSRPG